MSNLSGIRISTHPVVVAEQIAGQEAFIAARDAREAALWSQARVNNAARRNRERSRWVDAR